MCLLLKMPPQKLQVISKSEYVENHSEQDGQFLKLLLDSQQNFEIKLNIYIKLILDLTFSDYRKNIMKLFRTIRVGSLHEICGNLINIIRGQICLR